MTGRERLGIGGPSQGFLSGRLSPSAALDDALAGIAHRVAADPELLAVARERLDLLRRDRVGERTIEARGRHVVVHRGDGEVGPPYLAAGQGQAAGHGGR